MKMSRRSMDNCIRKCIKVREIGKIFLQKNESRRRVALLMCRSRAECV